MFHIHFSKLIIFNSLLKNLYIVILRIAHPVIYENRIVKHINIFIQKKKKKTKILKLLFLFFKVLFC